MSTLIDIQYFINQRPGSNRFPRIRPGNVRMDDGWSELHGPTIKAANTKGFVPCCRDIARLYFTSGTDADQAVINLLGALSQLYRLLYDAPLFIPAETVDIIREICANIGENWLVLRAE